MNVCTEIWTYLQDSEWLSQGTPPEEIKSQSAFPACLSKENRENSFDIYSSWLKFIQEKQAERVNKKTKGL